MATSEFASKILDALNNTNRGSRKVEIPIDEDLIIGPVVFRFGFGPQRDRWALVREPGMSQADKDYMDAVIKRLKESEKA
ncbi:hypothetical protein ACFTUC_17385 [Streptomyces sp. NPDC056944]|uniref:hypothetical protein n=1 Tax=Streptomyces sp. NPDC056944 TaxID=3345972 RepID=UPI003632C259